MIIKSKALALILVTLFFSGILLASSAGWWKTESSKQAAVFTDGDYAGQANPADIRGSYTFADVEKNFGIKSEILGKAFGVSDNIPAFQVKTLESLYGDSTVEIGTGSVRLFVALYKGLPYEDMQDSYLPVPAAEILLGRDITPPVREFIQSHTAQPTAASSAQPTAASSAQPTATPQPQTSSPTAMMTPTGASDTGQVVKGKTTVGELIAWGVQQDVIDKILGSSSPVEDSVVLKTWCTDHNLDWETIKTQLQEEVNR